MSNSMTERGQPITLPPSTTSPAIVDNNNNVAPVAINSPRSTQQPNMNTQMSPVDSLPSAPPPAYVPPPECRSSRIYGLEDIGPNSQPDNDHDPERAMPPPPYTAPQRQPTIFLFSSRPTPAQPGDAASGIVYPNAEIYAKATRRRRLYGMACFMAFLILGIILLVNLLRPRD